MVRRTGARLHLVAHGLAALAAALAATVDCGPGAVDDPPSDRPIVLFDHPIKISGFGRRWVRVGKAKELAREYYIVPLKRFVTDAPVMASGTKLVSGGKMMAAHQWRGVAWACLMRRFDVELPAVVEGAGVCVRDSDADGRADRALLAGKEWSISPVRLAPLTAEDDLTATQVSLILEPNAIDESSLTLSRSTSVRTGVFPHSMSGFGSDADADDEAETVLKPVPGKTYRLGQLELTLARRGHGRWWARADGAFNDGPQLCTGGASVLINGLLISG